MSISYPFLPQQFHDRICSLPYSRRHVWLAVFGLVVCLLVANNFDSGRAYLADSSDHALLEDIKNSTLGFQEIFVVNMKYRTDRRDGLALIASYTNVSLTFTEAVTEVSHKTLPNGGEGLEVSEANIGSWRSHLNVVRRIVEENIQSALILEDDVDWDLRIHGQLMEFAQASRLLLQPLPLSGLQEQYLDPTYHGNFFGLSPETFVVGEHHVTAPKTSPYGDLDKWDMLWLGHCGASIPTGDGNTPLARAVILNDQTVPEKQHINPEIGTAAYRDDFPAHSRVVFRTGGNVCSLAYALTNTGARRLLYELGIEALEGTFDNELEAWCRGQGGPNRPLRTCLTVGPQYFQHHRPQGSWGGMSDISEHDPHYNPTAYSDNIRYSARVNLAKLINGDTDYTDSYKDGEPGRE